MFHIVEAIVAPQGRVHLRDKLQLTEPRRAIVIVLDEKPAATATETALLSEPALNQNSVERLN